MSGLRNKCAVSHHPAGHPMACNDCDPCMLGSAPGQWCRVCDGDGWVFASEDDEIGERCSHCTGAGFEPLPNPSNEGGERG